MKTAFWKSCAILATIAAAAFAMLWQYHPATVEDFLAENRYPLLDPARNIVAQGNFIINLTPLREELRDLVGERAASSTTLYFEFLNTGGNISINDHLSMLAASLPKLPLAMVVAKKIENGEWTYDSTLVLSESVRDDGSGELYKEPMGTAFTIEKLLEEMLIHSDNTAYHILLENVADADLLAIEAEIGIEQLGDSQGKTTAKEYSRLYRALYTSSFLTRENSSKILGWLLETDFDKYLASGLPRGTPFANKWGKNTNDNVYHDSGIVYIPGRPYILTVMVQGDGSWNEDALAQDLMHDISEKVYSYIASYKK